VALVRLAALDRMETTSAAADAASAFDGTLPPAAEARIRRRRRAGRTVVYCLVSAALASVLMFWELGADALTADEAQYALVVQNIKRSGEWLYVSPYPPAPYFQKPPLYFWLTALTYDRLGGPDELAYRAWSAAAGVGAVVLTCVLGAMLLTPEIGALAALLLLTNKAFLLVHGARSGTFDALVTFLITAGVVIYWAAGRGRRGWIGWIGVGVCAGLASLTKPFVGVPLVVLLAIHSLFVERGGATPGRRGVGILLGILSLVAVAAPWYEAQRHKYPAFAGEMFGKNLVERVTQGVDDKQLESWYFYPELITKSSLPFALAIPAVAFAFGVWVAGGTAWRSRYALLTLIGGGWVLLFSLSASKAIHYVYPTFPALAVMIAAGAVVLARKIGERWTLTPAGRTRAAVATAILVTACVAFQYGRILYLAIPADRSAYVPWEMYRALSPAIRAGDARVIIAGFPQMQTEWRSALGLRARDCYYLEQLRALPSTMWLRDATELSRVLQGRIPALVIVSARADARGMLDELTRQQRVDERFVYTHEGYTAVGTDLARLLDVVARPGETKPIAQIDQAASPGTFRLTITPPVQGGIDVSVRLRLENAPAGSAVRYTYMLETAEGRKTIEDQIAASSADGTLEVAAEMEQQLFVGPNPFHLTLTLRDGGSALLAPVRSTVDTARVRFLPQIPVERHPRR
jgi:4-amino-4-deoxy-L-arabinose transferase-like glycosyltransferase